MSTTPPVFSTWKRWFWPALAITAVLDQASKCWLFSSASAGVDLPGWIVRHHNPGMAWSAFDRHPGLVALSTALLVPVLAFVWWRWYRPLGRRENLAFGLILGGALGNGTDRLVLVPLDLAAGVRDFISIDLHPVGIPYIWPTFNIADAGICVGFVLLIIAGLLPGQAKPRPAITV